jgi:two-component system sensor histidine kinase VicK
VIVEDLETTVLIKVEDTGIGIPAAIQPFIFDKFTKARRPGIHGEPTTGLGLSIIKTIIEWHNGRIWFVSAEEKGTTFFIQIPKNNQ